MTPLSDSQETQVLTSGEITSLFESVDGGKPAETLMKVVELIASRFKTEVCSAYLLEPDRSTLVLAATVGLHPRCIGKLRIPLNEGLTGLVAETVMPVAVADAMSHPRFKLFKELEEETFHSFLGVPIVDRGVLQGTLILQTRETRTFTDEDIRMLVDAANQVAPIISEARTFDRFIAPTQERLWSLANNIWWSWDPDCISLFRDLNPTRWTQLNQNPVALLVGDVGRRGGAARDRTGAAQPHQLLLPAAAGVSPRRPDMGRAECGRAAEQAGGVLLR